MSSSTNTTLNPLEELILQHVGQVAIGNLASLIVLSLFYGVFLTLFSMSVYMTVRRGQRNFATWVVLVGSSVNFALQTVQWILVLTWLAFVLQLFLVHDGSLSLEDRLALAKAKNVLLTTTDDLTGIPLLISDAFVIWRASVLFDPKHIMSIPIVCLLASVGVYIANAATPPDQIIIGDKLTWALSALSLGTNIISTGMIGWRLWIYRKNILPTLGENKSPVHQVIVTLIESGAVFCLIQIGFLIISILSRVVLSGQDTPLIIIITQQVLFNLGAIYPTAILLICRKQSSHIDHVVTVSRGVIGNELRFATMQASQSQSVAVSAADFAPRTSRSSVHEPKVDTGDLEIGK